MAKPSGCNQPSPGKQPWGTWEELLLACAVHRYGPDSWDCVASEVQRRSPSLASLTGLSCRLKYHDLRRRFRETGCRRDDAGTTNNNINKNDDGNNNNNNRNGSVPWLEELRQLRVAELRREVERYDLSIVSLQLKVKRLTEEREKEASDLVGKAPEKASSGEDSDRENRSVNESNSTDPKSGNPPPRADEERKPPVPGPTTGDPSCNSVAEEPAEEKWPERPDGGGGEGKESSEVQSLARREEGKAGKAEEEDNEGDRSPAVRCIDVESQPLAGFLEILRSHSLASFFQRRLETQETNLYTRLIRQHVDLETVRSRFEGGRYSGYSNKFFRDLLLLFNNAIVFFNKRSPECLAAIELRQLVSKEMARDCVKASLTVKEKSPELQDQEPENSLDVKPKMRVVMVACRKRSSIPTKASFLFSGGANKGEDQNSGEAKSGEDQRADNSPEEKPAAVKLKKQEKSSDKAEESHTTKKRTRERPNPSTKPRITNKNSRTRSSSVGTNKDSDVNSKTRGSLSTKTTSPSQKEDSKVEKETRGGSTNASKKKGAASFLNRMKRGSSSASNEPLLESLRQPATGSNNGKGKEIKKSGNSGSDAKRTQSSRKGSSGKQETQRASPVKKGRPPKRAAVPPPPPQVVSGKRSRDGGGAGAGSSAPAKKRSRR